MTKVFIVTAGTYDDYRICSVYRSKAQAEAFAGKCNADPGFVYCEGDKARVEEHVLADVARVRPRAVT